MWCFVSHRKAWRREAERGRGDPVWDRPEAEASDRPGANQRLPQAVHQEHSLERWLWETLLIASFLSFIFLCIGLNNLDEVPAQQCVCVCVFIHSYILKQPFSQPTLAGLARIIRTLPVCRFNLVATLTMLFVKMWISKGKSSRAEGLRWLKLTV